MLGEHFHKDHFPISVKNAKGNIIYAENINGGWVKIEYNSRQRVTKLRQSDGFYFKNEFDKNGNLLFFENSLNIWRRWSYDECGNLTKYQDSLGSDLNLFYNQEYGYLENELGKIVFELFKQPTDREINIDGNIVSVFSNEHINAISKIEKTTISQKTEIKPSNLKRDLLDLFDDSGREIYFDYYSKYPNTIFHVDCHYNCRGQKIAKRDERGLITEYEYDECDEGENPNFGKLISFTGKDGINRRFNYVYSEGDEYNLGLLIEFSYDNHFLFFEYENEICINKRYVNNKENIEFSASYCENGRLKKALSKIRNSIDKFSIREYDPEPHPGQFRAEKDNVYRHYELDSDSLNQKFAEYISPIFFNEINLIDLIEHIVCDDLKPIGNLTAK